MAKKDGGIASAAKRVGSVASAAAKSASAAKKTSMTKKVGPSKGDPSKKTTAPQSKLEKVKAAKAAAIAEYKSNRPQDSRTQKGYDDTFEAKRNAYDRVILAEESAFKNKDYNTVSKKMNGQ